MLGLAVGIGNITNKNEKNPSMTSHPRNYIMQPPSRVTREPSPITLYFTLMVIRNTAPLPGTPVSKYIDKSKVIGNAPFHPFSER